MTNKTSHGRTLRFSPSRSLGARLLVWFFAVSVFPLLIIGIIGYNLSQKTGNSAAIKVVEHSFRERLDILNHYFHGLRKNQQLVSIYLTSHSLFPAEALRSVTGSRDIIMTDKAGRTIFSLAGATHTGLYRYLQSKDPKNTGIMITPVLSGSSSNPEAFYVISPHSHHSDTTLAFLAIQYDTDSLKKVLWGGESLGPTAFSCLIDRDGNIMLMQNQRNRPEFSVTGNEKLRNWGLWVKETGGHGTMFDKVSLFSEAGTDKLGFVQPVMELQESGLVSALYQEIGPGDAFGYSETINFIMIGLLVVIFVLVIITALLVTRSIVGPINELSAWASDVATGSLEIVPVKARQDEIGNMATQFTDVVGSFREITAVSESMAVGDFSKTVRVRSSHDRLGISINQMLESFKGVIAQAVQISRGDFSGDIAPRGDNDSLGIALRDMTRTLRDSTTQIKNQDWLKSGMAELGVTLSGDRNVQDLTREGISFLVKYLNAQLGLFYLKEDDTDLVLYGTYAFNDRKGNHNRLKMGEGLAGQAAMEQQMILFNDVGEGAAALNYSVNEKIPPHYILVPLVTENELAGVIQIGSMTPFTELHKRFVEQASGPMAVALQTSRSRSRVKQLLDQTQIQADRLQVQQEELQQTNEELEEQTRALKASEETLQAQQEELRVVNEELEERTKLLEEQRDNIRLKNLELEKAWKEIGQKAKDLETASQYKSEFLANMSHELRTPLNSIIVLSQLLSENRGGNLTKKQLEFSRTIHSSGSDLLALINEILDLSKIESGKIDIHPEMINLETVMDQLRQMFFPLTEKKGLELITDILPGTPAEIFTDFQRLQQILNNLLSNAVKFTEKGTVRITAGLVSSFGDISSPAFHDGQLLAFRVSDTGIGIAPDKMKVIFEAFQQADGTTSRKFGGTGLGLTISRSFARILGGEIQVSSSEGKGTAFTLILPLTYQPVPLQKEQADPSPVTFSAPPENTEPKEYSKTHGHQDVNAGEMERLLLIIEDDASFSEVIKDLAEERGYRCLVAPDGESGLTLALKYRPGAIILDIGLPDISGWEVLDRLKENPATRHIPVHFMSAYEKTADALRLGAIGFLTKPVSVEKMNAAFRRIEEVISKPVKKLLVVEDDPAMRRSIVELIGNGDVQTTSVGKGMEACALLEQESFDCLILDLGLEDMSGFDLLEKIRKNSRIAAIPTIIYTGKELTRQEEEKLQRYADSIIIKGIRSPERLLAETTLFLHRVESNLPRDKQEMLRMIYNKEEVFAGKTILLVDDDSRNLFALTSVLEERGIVVITATNGREGLGKLRENPAIDLVLMDLMMPEMDGIESISLIRKDPEYNKIPVIALTAKAMKEDRQKCLEAGANDYLSKPVDNQKLLSLLRVWLHP